MNRATTQKEGTMNIEVSGVEVNEIMPLRELHRQEMNCQIIHDSFPRRGFSNPYLIRVGGRIAGYGLVANQHWPDTVNEFYTSPAYEAAALPVSLDDLRRLHQQLLMQAQQQAD